MRQLILLYWGCVFLIYLSQIYYPGEQMLDSSKMRMRHFLLYKADIFIVLTIAWICCFSFLRESYNDSPLSSKKQKNNCRQRYPGFGCPFFNSFQGPCLLAAA